MIATWQAPTTDGKSSEELILSIDRGREKRVLILPALFDEANKLRRFTVQVMRQLDTAGVDSFLPDMPGCNESLAKLEHQTLSIWRDTAAAAAEHTSATHILAIRAGALVAPDNLPGWIYAPQTGAKVLRAMIRARTIASREAGREETSTEILEAGRKDGLVLAGWSIGAEMLRQLESAAPAQTGIQSNIDQKTLGGPGLWLRAEPSEDAGQAEALAAIIADTGADA